MMSFGTMSPQRVKAMSLIVLLCRFVQFRNPMSAMTAARELHNTKWGEFPINVQWERPSPVTVKEKHGNVQQSQFVTN